LPELVADGETGVLVPPNDADALAEGIEVALGQAARFGAAGRKRARERFSVARMADATLDVYEEVTATAARPERTRHPPPTQSKGGAEA
jgi:starch synthase